MLEMLTVKKWSTVKSFHTVTHLDIEKIPFKLGTRCAERKTQMPWVSQKVKPIVLIVIKSQHQYCQLN